jgi:NitT/TauT family transport system substrate-binding protein
MNQGDPTESRVYYLPHFVARNLGFFERVGLRVDFVWAEGGDGLAHSGQVPAVERGEADLTIGGPMVTMRKQADEGKRIVNFCAAVRANPWFLVARQAEPDFQFADLAGKTVVDMANITTATLCFNWLLAHNGIADQVRVVPGCGDAATDLAAFADGRADYLLHSLHVLGALVATHDVAVVQALATPTGPVPWSAYIALPATIEAYRPAFVAFTSALDSALRWINQQSGAEIAQLVSPEYPSMSLAALTDTVDRYLALRLWPDGARIPREDFEHFRSLLIETGWLTWAVPYEDQVNTVLADEAAYH